MVRVSPSSASCMRAMRSSVTCSTLEPTTVMAPPSMPMTSPAWMGLPSAACESRTACVTSPSRISPMASVMASAFSSALASVSTANMAAKACGTVLVGTTTTLTSSLAAAAASAAMRMLPLSGRTMTLSALARATASRMSAVLGFIV